MYYLKILRARIVGAFYSTYILVPCCQYSVLSVVVVWENLILPPTNAD